MKQGFPAPALFAFFLVSSCAQRDDYFHVGSAEKTGESRKLLELLRDEEDSESRFILVQQLAGNLMAAGAAERLNLFLTSQVEQYPDDPFNAWRLLLVARNYGNAGAYPLAAHYYERILRNHPDILLRGQSVHLLCLKELVRLTGRPEYRIAYYKELLARFRGDIDEGSTYFYMAKTYESLGEWEQAVQAYTNVLKYPEAAPDGNADVHRQIMQLLAFHNSDKRWTQDNLDDLVTKIKNAIEEQDARELARLRAGVNFFTMSWEQEETSVNTQLMFDLGPFLRGSRVGCARDLDPASTATEAYLETWGWSYRVPKWYLYFRKINYPGDPEINGRWEWVGIYFGEKL